MLPITGNLRKRFVQATGLLHMLDPVRGEPTTHGLDQDPHEIEAPRERLLKRKFLDSFALVCSIEKDGDSVSAACMEEGAPQGTIIRVASNAGVRQTTLIQLQQILDLLNKVAGAAIDTSTAENEVILRIIRIDIKKIRHYLNNIRNAKCLFEDPIPAIAQRVRDSWGSNSPFDDPALQRFLDWFRYLSTIKDMPPDANPEVFSTIVIWAQEAKRHHLEYLKGAFADQSQQLPLWIRAVFKLGRYSIASRVFIQFTSEFPALFNPMTVQAVAAPAPTNFIFDDQETPLACVLRRVAGASADQHLARLAGIWNATDAEAHFRRACSRTLTVHAEIQLVAFYDHNPHAKPSVRFLGVSKKSCYLCRIFLTTHPDSFVTSSCHQKLYASWSPPLATDPEVYRRYKVLTTDLSKTLEATAKEELKSRLGSSRRPIPADSTAGVSLSGLTNSDVVRTTTGAFNSWVTRVRSQSTTEAVTTARDTAEVQSEQMNSPVETVSLTPDDGESCFDFNQAQSIIGMAILFTRAEDADRQDIVQMRDILNASTSQLSWSKLVKILEVDDGVGIGFVKGRDFLVFNTQIRVRNERQFFACLQYLHNLNMLSSEATVHRR